LQKALAVPDIGVLSAFSRDTIVGCVYVEAPAIIDVQTALQDVNGVTYSRQGTLQLDLIPLDDRVPLLTMAYLPNTMTVASWVRIKRRGRYRNHLGLVSHVSDNNTATVSLVPKIILDRKRKRQERVRIKPALFDVEAVKAAYGAGQVVQHNQAWIFGGETYMNRLVELDFELRELSDRYVNATQLELDVFRQTRSKWIVDAANSIGATLHVADKIQVVAGPLQGLHGRVTDIREDCTVTFETDGMSGFQQARTWEVCKRFALGDFVQLVVGERRGAEGFIVRMDDATATIYTRCVEVRSDQCHSIICHL
jgi:ribosomal protein L24